MNLSPKMEKWIKNRLWNLRVKSEPMAVQQISSELIDFFGLKLTAKTEKDLISEIEKIRYRTYKRYEKWKALRKEWATQLALPEQLIQRWYRKGWIDPQKKDNLSDLMGIIFERDYYLAFIAKKNIDDQIPEDPDVSLSDV
jgi:hypothetical protein